MKLAVFSDVHANLPALEAVLEDIDRQQPDAVYCLGDLVNQNAWNNEVVDLIRARHIPCIMGNHDQGIGNGRSKFKFSYSLREEMAWGYEAIAYTLQQVTPENKRFLRNLPGHIRLDFDWTDNAFSLLMVHGSPSSINEYVFDIIFEEELRPVLDSGAADILLMGHTHHAYHRIVSYRDGGKTCYRHAINAGSVGYPKDSSWCACYALIRIDERKDVRHDAGAVQVSFPRLDYDLNKVVKAIQHSGLPLFYAGRLLK